MDPARLKPNGLKPNGLKPNHMARQVRLLTLPPRNMGIAAEVLEFMQDFCSGLLHQTFCTGQTRKYGLVISCNPYP
jgi:hypothetical protein